MTDLKVYQQVCWLGQDSGYLFWACKKAITQFIFVNFEAKVVSSLVHCHQSQHVLL